MSAVGLVVIEALKRRAAAQQGPAQQLMLQRVDDLLRQHATAQRAAAQADLVPDENPVRRAALAGLSALADSLGRTPSAPTQSTPRSLKAVTAFKGTWSRLRAEQRLRQALAQVPAMAGPLHSSQVVNRALQALQQLSPAYLDAFMAHVDTLLWLEQASGGNAPAPRAATAADGVRSRQPVQPGPSTSRPRRGHRDR